VKADERLGVDVEQQRDGAALYRYVPVHLGERGELRELGNLLFQGKHSGDPFVVDGLRWTRNTAVSTAP
jgi:hypothetical protein